MDHHLTNRLESIISSLAIFAGSRYTDPHDTVGGGWRCVCLGNGIYTPAVQRTLRLSSSSSPIAIMQYLFCLLISFFLSLTPIQSIATDKRWYFPSEVDVLSVTVQELQQFLSNGTITSVQLTQHYLVSLWHQPFSS